MRFQRIKKDHEILQKSIFPINDTEEIIPRLARSFPAEKRNRLEVFGYFVGLKKDKLTHLVIPKFVVGLPGHIYEMIQIGGTGNRTQVLLAANEETGEPGILIAAQPEENENRLLRGNYMFISSNLLILNRPITEFVPAEARTRLFARMKAREITERQLVEKIMMSHQKKRIWIQNEKKRWASVFFLPGPALNIDAFVSVRRSCPLNRFLRETLDMNTFKRKRSGSDKTCYGRIHIHYGYNFMELMRDPMIQALHFMDKNFFELMTPVDAKSMINSRRVAQEISDQRLQAEQILEGVIALNPKSLEIVGMSYFDMAALEKGKKIDEFIKVADKSYGTRNIDAHKSWFQYVRTAITPRRPDYASP